MEQTGTYRTIEQAVEAAGLTVYGVLHPARTPAKQLDSGTLVLLGTAAGFWKVFQASSEHLDGGPDPVDRWSQRVVTGLGAKLGAAPYFPFTGPPYAPFIDWALGSGRAFTSPSQMMVHDQVGMLISLRGALHFTSEFDIPPPPLAASPCEACTAKPCLSACPAGAMVDGGPYRLAACHHHLDTAAGSECLSQGCLARLACPLSAGAGRSFQQTAHHMRYFHAR
jgi:hypothetical protein